VSRRKGEKKQKNKGRPGREIPTKIRQDREIDELVSKKKAERQKEVEQRKNPGKDSPLTGRKRRKKQKKVEKQLSQRIPIGFKAKEGRTRAAFKKLEMKEGPSSDKKSPCSVRIGRGGLRGRYLVPI